MKEMRLNFNINEKAPSGRFYDHNNFSQKINEQIKRGTFFLEYSGRYSSTEVELKNIIGFIVSCEIKKDGEVVFNVIPNNEVDNKYLNVIDECALSATGYVDKEGNALINKIVCLRPSPAYSMCFDDMEKEDENEPKE
jgi:hypothetical protein